MKGDILTRRTKKSSSLDKRESTIAGGAWADVAQYSPTTRGL